MVAAHGRIYLSNKNVSVTIKPCVEIIAKWYPQKKNTLYTNSQLLDHN